MPAGARGAPAAGGARALAARAHALRRGRPAPRGRPRRAARGGEPAAPAAHAALAAARHAHATLVAASPEDWKPDDGAGGPVLLPWIYETIPAAAPWQERSDLLFVPGLQPAPAVDALLWLRDELLPRLTDALGPLRVFVPAWPALRPLLEHDPRLQPLPDAALEAARPFDRFRVALAPLRFGGGVAGRIQPALAAGLPCVASPAAARPLPDALRSSLSLAGDPAGFTREVVRLYRDADAWNGASTTGRSAVDALFGFARARERMRALLASRP